MLGAITQKLAVPLRHRLHQLVAIAARGAHYERQAVLDVQLGVGVDGGGVRVVDRDQIQIADGRPDAGDARFDLGDVRRGHELDGGRFLADGIAHGDLARLDVGTRHGHRAQPEALAQAGLGGGRRHRTGHPVDHHVDRLLVG